MSRVVAQFDRPFIVEIAETHHTNLGRRVPGRWEFAKAFYDEDDARDFAESLSETHEFVRVAERGRADA